MKKTNGNYFTIPNDIFKLDIDAKDFFVYCYLKKCAGMSGKCFPSIKTIAKATHMSPTTVKKATNKLVDEGLIDVTARYDGVGRLSNLYTINKIWPSPPSSNGM